MCETSGNDLTLSIFSLRSDGSV